MAPVLAAGGTFAGGTLLGLLAGIGLGRTTGQAAWVAIGFFAGLLAGGYSAYRLLARSM